MDKSKRRKSEIKGEEFYNSTRPIPSLVGYRIDRSGNLYSCLRKGGGHPIAKLAITNYWRQLSPKLNSFGYLCVGVTLPSGKRVHRRISRLVLEAWAGPCPPGYEACHNDGNRINNDISNLRWDTMVGNQRDRLKHGTSCRGIHCQKKLTPEQVIEIRQLRSSGVGRREIAEKFGISAWHVDKIHKRINWWYLKDDETLINQ